MKKHFFLYLLFLAGLPTLIGQECIGGQIHTNESFLYGRFEVSMRSAEGDGIVSSFFLYNLDVGCNWPAENNELDIEMLGNGENLLFTTHYPGPWFYTDTYTPNFNPHAALHEYAFEWEPGIVRWFVDGELVVVQDQPFVKGLSYPMRIIMNLWAAELESWVGPWDPSIMPVQSEYDYVRFYEYTPGSGSSGTNENFTFSWEDEFDSLDTNRWTVELLGGFGGNYCTFKPSSVEVGNGLLLLQLEPADLNAETVPVTFSVDLNGEGLAPTDVINLNGTFNDWCGQCAPMSEENGIWSLTLNLPPGEHQYLFTKNFWEENGGAPLGSICDFQPCDQWANYGLIVPIGSEPIVLDTPCWAECVSCAINPVFETNYKFDRKVVKIFDLLGREVEFRPGKPLIYLFDDGSVERYIKFE